MNTPDTEIDAVEDIFGGGDGVYTQEEMERAGYRFTGHSVIPPARQHDRRFLERFPAERRSHVANLFLAQVRHGLGQSLDVVHAVADDVWGRCAQSAATAARYADIGAALRSWPDEALDYAAWCVVYERMTPEQKAREKAQRAVEGINVWMEAQSPTDKRIALLRKLGHSGQAASKAEASRLIDGLLQKQRTQPQSRAGLGDHE